MKLRRAIAPVRTAPFVGVAAVVAAVLTGTCDAGPPGSPGGGSLAATVRDSAGVRIVELAAPDTASARRLVPDTEWTPAPVDGQLAALAVAAPGPRLALLDELGPGVRMLSPDGSPGRWVGGEGDGPGELSREGLSDVVATADGVAVPDLRQHRVTRWGWDGGLRDVRRVPGEGTYAVEWRAHPDGGLVYRVFRPEGDLLVRWDDGVLDTLHAFDGTDAGPNRVFSPVSLWDLGPERTTMFGRSDRGAVELRRGDGSRWIARLPGDGRPVRDDDRDHVFDLTLSLMEERPGEVPPMTRNELAGMLDFADRVPRLAGLRLAPDGSVWLRLAAPVEAMGTGALRVGRAEGFGGPWWMVLEPDGRPRETVRLPGGFHPAAFAGPWLYGWVADGMDVRRPRRVRWSTAPDTPISPPAPPTPEHP